MFKYKKIIIFFFLSRNLCVAGNTGRVLGTFEFISSLKWIYTKGEAQHYKLRSSFKWHMHMWNEIEGLPWWSGG